jgi:hypothetical protein
MSAELTLRADFGLPLSDERDWALYCDILFGGYRSPVRVTVLARWVRDLPLVVDFDRVLLDGKARTRSFRVHPCGTGADVVAVAPEHPSVTACVTESSAANACRVDVSISEQMLPGLFSSRLLVTLGGETEPRTIIVRANVAPPIEAAPGTLRLGTIRVGTKRTYALTLASTVGRPFEVRGVSTNVESLECRCARADSAGTSYNVQVTFAPRDAVGKLAGNIEISTSEVQCPLVVVPVFGVSSSSGEQD